MPSERRYRHGEFEFVAQDPPPAKRLGNPASRLAAPALKAMDELKCNAVLVLADSTYSFAGTQNKHAEADGITGVKFVARNPHKIGDKTHHDIYAIRVDL